MNSDSTQQSRQDLESQSGNDQRIKVEPEEQQPPERAFSVNIMTEKSENEEFGITDDGVRKDFEISKTLMFPLVNWKVEKIGYDLELREYLTIREFTERIKKFNAISRKLRINRMIMITPWILISILLITSIVMIKNANNSLSLERIVCGIFLFKIVVGTLVYYWFILRKGKRQIKYLNNLLEEFNKKDIAKNVNWKLIESDKYVDNKDSKMCLAIELGSLPMYQEHPSLPKVSRVITIHDCNRERHNNKSNSIVNIRESIRSIDSDIGNYQIRTAIKTRYYYEAMPNIPPPAYYEGAGNAMNATLTDNNNGDDRFEYYASSL